MIQYRPLLGADEFEAALAIRHRVFVVEQGVPEELERDSYDASADHFLALAQGHAVGTSRLVQVSPQLGKIGRVAVEKDWQGKGLGQGLMAVTLEHARQKGLAQVMLDSQLDAIPFYERLGFKPEGPEFEDAGILHRRMRMELS